jgi:hypothetical protein
LKAQLHRRDFLRLGAIPFLGLGSPGAGHGNCILLVLNGGPSHLDTWDMKPDAPSEIRGPFRPIRTNVPGIEISEIFPRMAKQAHRYALIRSVHDTAHPVHAMGRAPRSAADPLAGPEFNAKYGRNRFGQGCFNALRQIESGARFVTVDMFDTVFDEATWDIHGWRPFSPISCYRDVVGPMYDMACSTLLDDLSDRGLLETTLVVSMGEFGRTPKINPSGGRDHWPHCFTIQMAGGGIRGGQVYGSSDATGAEPRDRPVCPADVVATIHKVLGIPPDTEPLHALFV